MNTDAFFDTNILIYLYSIDEPEKQQIALQKIKAIENRWISTQVLSEISNTLYKKFKLDYKPRTNKKGIHWMPFLLTLKAGG